jgi:hypothetical protein
MNATSIGAASRRNIGSIWRGGAAAREDGMATGPTESTARGLATFCMTGTTGGIETDMATG